MIPPSVREPGAPLPEPLTEKKRLFKIGWRAAEKAWQDTVIHYSFHDRDCECLW